MHAAGTQQGPARQLLQLRFCSPSSMSFPAPRALVEPSLGPGSWPLPGSLPQPLLPATVGPGNPDSSVVRGLCPAWHSHRSRRREGGSATLGTSPWALCPRPSLAPAVSLSPQPVSPCLLCTQVHNSSQAPEGRVPLPLQISYARARMCRVCLHRPCPRGAGAP